MWKREEKEEIDMVGRREESWEMEEQVEMYQRNRRVWRQQWKERGWKVFWELKVGAKVLNWEEWWKEGERGRSRGKNALEKERNNQKEKMDGKAGRGRVVEWLRWRVEMALEAGRRKASDR